MKRYSASLIIGKMQIKTIRMAITKKNRIVKCWHKHVEKLEPCALLMWLENGAASMETLCSSIKN